MAQMTTTSLTINGKRQTITALPDTPLLWVLRENLKLTGTKFGCGAGQCGACMVHVDGKSVFSCLLPISEMAGRSITTIEGLAPDSNQIAESVARGASSAMRLLPVGADHARGGPAENQSAADARRDRRAYEHQHLPLRDVRAHRACGRARREGGMIWLPKKSNRH